VLKQFQKALVIAEHLSLGQLRVSCQTYFVRYLFPRQLFFRLPYHRDFGDGVNAVRNEIRRHLSGLAKHVTTGETPLFHRGACQRRKSDHISGRVNVRNPGLEVLVHRKFAPPISTQPSCSKVQQITIGLPADRV